MTTPFHGRATVEKYISSWKALSYSYSLTEDAKKGHVYATFSKPTPAQPVPQAVAHLTFALNRTGERIFTYRVENERHLRRLKDKICFNEVILDQVIQNKLKWTPKFDVHDDFTQMRCPDLVPQDLTTMLLEHFISADKDAKGLDYSAFKTVLESNGLNLAEDEMQTLFANADSGCDGRIEYRQFVPLVVDLGIRHDLKDHATNNSVEYEQFLSICKVELAPIVGMMQQIFLAADYRPPGKSNVTAEPTLSPKMFARCIHAPVLGFSPEEIKIMTLLARKDKDGNILYANYEQLLSDVKYRVYRAQQIATGPNAHIRDHLLDLIKREDGRSIMNRLRCSSRLMMSAFQLYSVMGDAIQGDDGTLKGQADEFATRAAKHLSTIFGAEYLRVKAQVVQEIATGKEFQGKSKRTIEQSMAQYFEQHDKEGCGVIPREEFYECLKQQSVLQLSTADIRQLVNIADGDATGSIDYEEFVAVLYTHLLRMAREAVIFNKLRPVHT